MGARNGKIAAAVEQLHATLLAHREVLSALAIAAGHTTDALCWEHRPGFEERWDLMHENGRWLGGVVVANTGDALVVRQATEPPVDGE